MHPRQGKPRWSDAFALHIGDRSVGPQQPTYIIAEAGVNHNGHADTAFKLIEMAKRAGADAVKFQVFSAENLVLPSVPTVNYQSVRGHTNQREMLCRLELTRQEFVDLFHYAQDVGIEFLATAFGVDDLQFLSDLGVTAIKLASSDLVNTPLVECAIRSQRPVIASTGACTIGEIDHAVELFSEHAALSRLILMHCISSYPTPLTNANLRVMAELARRYEVPIGFSDHTVEWITGALAVAAGAAVLEKHITLDHRMDGPDHAFSLEEPKLTQYVAAVREAESAMGIAQRQVLHCEAEVRDLARGSVVSSVSIPSGTTLTSAMLTVKRPGSGIEPARLKELIGLCACRDIPADTPLSWNMVQPSGSWAVPKPVVIKE